MTLLGFLDILLLVLHVTVCIILCTIVLIQGGKGAALSASFGMGSSGSAFGARTDTFITKLTSGAAIAFVITSIALTFLASKTGSLSQRYEPKQEEQSTIPLENQEESGNTGEVSTTTETSS